MPNKTIFIGIFHRCQYHEINIISRSSKIYSICDNNKYCFYGNRHCAELAKQFSDDSNLLINMQEWCNIDNNPYNCDYSSITKGLISCTIISACTLGLSLILTFSHILINQFQ